MSKPFIVLLMVFCHMIDDYRLQGNLADFKQKKWWTKLFDKENIDEEKRKKYSHDYIAALIMHSLSWSFMIMLPIAYFFSFKPPVAFFVVYAANAVIHAVVRGSDRVFDHIHQAVGADHRLRPGFTPG